MIKAGIVGAGDVAEGTHAPAYREIQDVSLVAVAELEDQKLETFADKFDINNIFNDASTMFESVNLDIVSICTPPDSHKNIVLMAAEKGVNIYCEKPVATSIQDAKKMVDVINDAGVKAAAGYGLQYNRTFDRGKRQIENKIIGDIEQIVISYYNRNDALKEWRLDPTVAGGGVLMDLLPHILSYIFKLVDYDLSIESVDVKRYASQNIESDVHLEGMMRDISISIDVGYRNYGGPSRFCIFGTDGQVLIERSNLTLDAHRFNLRYSRSGLPQFYLGLIERTVGADPEPTFVRYSPFQGDEGTARIQAFVECVHTGKSNMAPLAESVDILSTISEIYEVVGINTPLSSDQ